MKTKLLCCIVLYSSIGFAKIPDSLITCIACHGKEGQSLVTSIPNLAGQHKSYLVKLLQDFKAKKYDSAIMSPIAGSMSQEDIEAVADYYAGLPRAVLKTPNQYAKRGEQLYRGGDLGLHITACIACHGPQGRGNADAGFPALSGQHAAYIMKELQNFKEKKRKNDFNHIMQDISARMPVEDMEAVAYYLQGLY